MRTNHLNRSSRLTARFTLYAVTMNESQWVQFSGPGTKRKRAELACIMCHSKKVCADTTHRVI